MGMVTLVQQQQQQQQQEASDNSQFHQRKEQEARVNAVASVEAHVVEHRLRDEVALEAVTVPGARAPVVPGNGSVGSSSTQCSDVDDNDDDDEEEEEEETDTEEAGNGRWVANLQPGPSTAVVQQAVETANGDLVLPSADPSSFGDVCVKNSTNVHLGNKTFYKGPVTIQQFVYTNPALVQDPQAKLESGRGAVPNTSDLSSTSKSGETANVPIIPQSTELNKVTQWLCTWRCAALLGALVLLLIVVMISSVYLSRDARQAPIFPEIPNSSINGVTVGSVRFVERNQWGAQPPSEPLKKMRLPVPYVIISHTVTDNCYTQSQCTLHVRNAQTHHMGSYNNWSDIGYNFLVGGDGLAYVGRSWDYVGSHALGFNSRSIGISFIGTFNSVIPPTMQLHAAQKIIEIGVKGGKIAKDYKLLGHRQVSNTESPGNALYSIIQKWPHWSPTP
ncbi:peptidoglycan-recognition protein LC [Ooceraea biroi]|uniref:peptidoglycan-recognition protein LC n=1 Tax=Ooceraea biroi TaxID=2015173 RepID=UPI000F07685A|nr:peptidoglycan-recognition protein LC [Ooceraea biroi]XP_019887088.2 peptidoglycan-recognition protein LC [Ooceraea biroi]